MKIAILGTRGIPARYGGFETLADQLSRRLVARGHQVKVYCRRPFIKADDQFDQRIRRVILPTISHKYFDTAVHTFFSAIHVSFTDADIILCCNVANSPWVWIPRLFGKPVALNVDGLDRKRRKWNVIGRSFLHFCEMLSTVTPTRIVTDARLVRDYFALRYRKHSSMIAYGAEPPPDAGSVKVPAPVPEKFILYVSRLEPENNPELVIEAYRRVQTEWPLVIVGGNPYDEAYVQRLKSKADQRVIFLGGIYGDAYWKLLKVASLYVFACEIGGIHPALIEAMSAAKPILFLDTPENRETIENCGVPFKNDSSDLAEKLSMLLSDAAGRAELARKAHERAASHYSWDRVTQDYENLFSELLGTGEKLKWPAAL
jgi:glycosyltransferase involved in cell wall biosynthesis